MSVLYAVSGMHQIENSAPVQRNAAETYQVSELFSTSQGILLPLSVSGAVESRLLLASSTLPPTQKPYTEPPHPCVCCLEDNLLQYPKVILASRSTVSRCVQIRCTYFANAVFMILCNRT